MYNIISTTMKQWILSGEPTKTEYRELAHLVRRFNYRGFMIKFKDRGAGRVAACYYRSAAGAPHSVCFGLDSAASSYIHTCVVLYKLAANDEERQEQINNAKEWVKQYGYGSRV